MFMFVYISFFIIIKESSEDLPISICQLNKPFKLKDNTCGNFKDVCVKTGDKECDNFQSACEQCPPNKITTLTLQDIRNIMKEIQYSTTKDLPILMKNLNERSIKNQNSLELKINKTQGNIQIISVIILILIIIMLVIIVVEIRFKLITKVFEKCMGREQKIKYRQRKIEKYNKLDTRETDRRKNSLKENEIQLKDISEKYCIKFDEIFNILKTKFVNKSSTKFEIKGVDGYIEVLVMSEDNIMMIKRKICAKWINSEPSFYKIMVLKHNGNPLDDNDYLRGIKDLSKTVIQCEINYSIDADEIIVLRIQGNINLPEIISIQSEKPVFDLKAILSNLSGHQEIAIYKDSRELEDKMTIRQCNLVDDSWIKVIERKYGQLKMKSIFDENNNTQVVIKYNNLDTILTLKKDLSQKLVCSFDDIVLFYAYKHLIDKKYIYEICMKDELSIRYCHLAKFDNNIKLNQNQTVKKCNLNSLPKFAKNKSLLKELQIYQILPSHPRIMKLNGLYKDEENLYIVVEKTFKTLKAVIKDNPMTENNIAKLSKQILQALDKLHENKIIHRDLRPINIHLDENNDIKLSGFALSKYLEDYRNIDKKFDKVRSEIGVFRYSAPELIRGETYDAQVDVWSFGAILIEMITGKPPLCDKGEPVALQEIASNPEINYFKPEGMSSQLKEFVDICLKANPNERATITKLLEHDFLKMYKDSKD